MARIGRRGDNLLLVALVGGATVRDAAGKAGLSERTAHRRIDDPGFQQRLESARSEARQEALGQLTSASTEAVTTLRELIKNGPPAVRLGASRAILDLGFKLHQDRESRQHQVRDEMSFDERAKRLEEQYRIELERRGVCVKDLDAQFNLRKVE